MIPKAARDLINDHLEQARKTEREDFAESMLNFALAADLLKPREHSNEVVLISLIRAQRRNRACAA